MICPSALAALQQLLQHQSGGENRLTANYTLESPRKTVLCAQTHNLEYCFPEFFYRP